MQTKIQQQSTQSLQKQTQNSTKQSQNLQTQLQKVSIQTESQKEHKVQDQHMIANRLKTILSKIESIRQLNKIQYPVRLVAVSKTKTVQQIKQAYDAGQRHFGQNYVDQIQQKHSKLPNEIKWHFIGHLQSNKIKKVIVPNLFVIQTVDRESLAEKIQKHLAKEEPNRILNIMIQIKTSQEQSKNGCEIEQLDNLYEYIVNKCPNLRFNGLMTIGKQGDMSAFETMYNLKVKMCDKYKLMQEDFELSMGMSGDYQDAVVLYYKQRQKINQQVQEQEVQYLVQGITQLRLKQNRLNEKDKQMQIV